RRTRAPDRPTHPHAHTRNPAQQPQRPPRTRTRRLRRPLNHIKPLVAVRPPARATVIKGTRSLGVEYLVLALVVTGVAVVLDRRAGRDAGSKIGRVLDAINPTFVTCSLLAVAAVVLILGHADGIYILVPALIAVLVGGVANAWLILVRLTD